MSGLAVTLASEPRRHALVTNVFHRVAGERRVVALYGVQAMALLWDGSPFSLDRYGSCSRIAAALCLGAACVVSGCTVDSRSLQSAGDPRQGEGGEAGGTSSTPGTITKPPAPIDLPVCEYPATDNVEPGCETIAENAGFTKDVAGWNPEAYSIKIGWDEGDATGDPESGSIVVTNTLYGTVDGLAPGGGAQCIPVAAGATYDMAGDLFIPEGQGDGMPGGGPYVGEAGLSILFWPNADCSDVEPTHGSFQTDLVQRVGVWTHVEGGAIAPDAAKAMSLRVLTIKPFKQFKFQALFDNVLLRQR